MSLMDPLEKLEALHEISAVKARYCRYIDTKQWRFLRDLFSADARFEGFGSAPDGCDADTFVKGVSERLSDAVSVHHCHMPEILFQGVGRARAVFAMQDHLEWPSPILLKEAPEARGFVGYGYYEEAYIREHGAWKIQFVRLTRLRIDPLPPGGAFAGTATLRRPSADWLHTA